MGRSLSVTARAGLIPNDGGADKKPRDPIVLSHDEVSMEPYSGNFRQPISESRDNQPVHKICWCQILCSGLGSRVQLDSKPGSVVLSSSYG